MSRRRLVIIAAIVLAAAVGRAFAIPSCVLLAEVVHAYRHPSCTATVISNGTIASGMLMISGDGRDFVLYACPSGLELRRSGTIATGSTTSVLFQFPSHEAAKAQVTRVCAVGSRPAWVVRYAEAEWSWRLGRAMSAQRTGDSEGPRLEALRIRQIECDCHGCSRVGFVSRVPPRSAHGSVSVR